MGSVLLIIIDDKTAVIGRLPNPPVGRAAVKNIEVARLSVEQVGVNEVTARTVRELAKPVDFAFRARVGFDNRLAQRLALDKILRQVIEGTIEVVVQPRIRLECPDQNLPIEPWVAVEREAGSKKKRMADSSKIGPRNFSSGPTAVGGGFTFDRSLSANTTLFPR